MTESEWLRAVAPDQMLQRTGERLSKRRWHLLACATVRRAWEAIPDGPFRETVDWVERHAGQLPDHPEVPSRFAALEAAGDAMLEAAREAQHAIVRPADPDADPESFDHAPGRRTNPAAPLFQAACTHAAASIDDAIQATETALRAVGALLQQEPGFALVDRIRLAVIEATRLRTAASIRASAALDLKVRGDETADRNTGKRVNLQYAAAIETAQKTSEQVSQKVADLEEQKEKAARKALGRFLHELLGNPFQPFRFEPHWRTDTVVGLAQAVDADRTFDKMPILADALLDADCDEEAILRHCRGTEVHAPEGAYHIRGCWVLDLILQREMELFSQPVLLPPPPPPAPPRRPASGAAPRSAPSGGGDPMARLLDALRRGAVDDLD
jgi:hypothetical protein